jgi:enterochelin esterase-like enzyme
MDFSTPKSLYILLLSLLFGAILAGCASPSLKVTPMPTDTPAATFTASQTPLPSATPEPTRPVCTQTTGTITTTTLTSKLSKFPTELKIYTPPCYIPGGEKKYPVLYMLHGQTYTDSQWIDLGLTSKADALISSGEVVPMIIVLPNEAESMTFADTSHFGDIMVDVVLPYIDSNYSVCTLRNCRAIGGLSRGGNWAVRIGLSHTDLFTAIGAHSAPLFYGDLQRVDQWVAASSAVPMIYIDFGKSDEDRADMLQFDQKLTDLDVAHQMLQFLGFHDADYWSAHTANYLDWYSQSFTSTAN